MTTNRTTKTLTNATWRHIAGDPLRTLTLTRITGKGALRAGDRYSVRENGVLHGSLTLVGRRGGMNMWRGMDYTAQHAWNYTGDQDSAAWSLAGDTAPTQN